MLDRVIVAHPGRQHSHQMAAALSQQDLLERYFCGIPTSPKTCPWYMKPFWRRGGDWDGDIDPQRVTCIPVGPFVRNLLMRLARPSIQSKIGHRCDGLFGRLVANKLKQYNYSAVVGYENASRKIFQVAKISKKITILDAASVHHQMQDRVATPSESKREHLRITANKDAEIELADFILTTSDMARESYLQAGADADRTIAIPMGVDIERFGSVPVLTKRDNALRIVFVGRFETLKGSDILKEAMEVANQQSVDIRLTIVGDLCDQSIASLRNVCAVGKKSHDDLAKILGANDVLVLPSRFDSFGMVVVEAMAAGLPVIVSPYVGSKMLVRPEWNGLVMNELTSSALLDAIKWFIKNQDNLPRMVANARQSAKSFAWSEYRRKVAELFADRLVADVG